MSRYTLGAYLTAFSMGALVGSLTGNYVAGMITPFVVIGIAYMITGVIETIIRVTRKS
jgi:hypothetical protein